MFMHDIRFGGEHVWLGAALVFGSAVSYSLYMLFSAQAVERMGSARLVGMATGTACLLCIAQFLILRPLEAMHVAPEVLWLSGVNAVFGTFVPVLLVMMAIKRIGAAAAAQVGLIGPLSTVLLAVFILDEPFTLWIAVGTALVLAGIGLLARSRA